VREGRSGGPFLTLQFPCALDERAGGFPILMLPGT
jgi:hypothetical protein